MKIFRQSFLLLSLSTMLVLSTSTIVAGVASKNDDNLIETLSNATAYSDSSSNGTAYQCQGPTKEEMKLYEILAWWMDAICQVILVRGSSFNDVTKH